MTIPKATIESALARARRAAGVIRDARPIPPRELVDEFTALLYQLAGYADRYPDAAEWIRSEVAALRTSVVPISAGADPPAWATPLLYRPGVLRDLMDDEHPES